MELLYPITYSDMSLGHESPIYKDYPKVVGIERETIEILREVPQDKAVNIAVAAIAEMPFGTGDAQVPAVVVFSREGINPGAIWDKLLKVLKTPDYETPSFDPESRPLIDALKGLLFKAGYTDGIVSSFIGAHIIRVAGGDPSAINSVYRDEARRYPTSSDVWLSKLERQFRGSLSLDTFQNPSARELSTILEKNEEIANRHMREHDKKVAGEDMISSLKRQLREAGEVFDIVDGESFSRAASVIDRIWRPYRQETYALRGIPYEY